LPETQWTVAQALRTPQFITLALAHFACCAAHSGPIFHMVSYAIGCGIAPLAAVSIYSVEGLAGLGGRVLLGLLADRFGAKPVLITGLLVQSFAIASYLGSNDTFDRALDTFAELYADQNERDYDALKQAAESGRVKAQLDL